MRAVLALGTVVAVTSLAVTDVSAARFEWFPSTSLATFRPTFDSRGYLTLHSPRTLASRSLSFGLVTSWSRALPHVDAITPQLQLAFGATSYLELGATLPFHVVSPADGPAEQSVGAPTLFTKARLLDPDRAPAGAALVLSAELTDEAPVLAPHLVVERQLSLRWRAAASIGPRPGAAVTFAIVPQRIDLITEVATAGATVAIRVRLATSSHFTLGAGAHPSRQAHAFLGIVFEPEPPRLALQADPEPVADPVPPADPDPEPAPPPIDDTPIPDPEPVLARESDGHIDVMSPVYFETDSAILRPESYPVLDAVARAILSNPDLALVEIEGHADARGSYAHNDALTQARADAVRAYLVDRHHIAPTRLEARGYGERRPIDPRSGPAAWDRNRRVEFRIVRRN